MTQIKIGLCIIAILAVGLFLQQTQTQTDSLLQQSNVANCVTSVRESCFYQRETLVYAFDQDRCLETQKGYYLYYSYGLGQGIQTTCPPNPFIMQCESQCIECGVKYGHNSEHYCLPQKEFMIPNCETHVYHPIASVYCQSCFQGYTIAEYGKKCV